MIKRLLLLFCFGFSFGLQAQQLPQYSQWFLHQFANNPAHAGIKKCVDLHTLYRRQWVGFEGAPNSGFLSVSIPLNTRRRRYLSARHGTGFKFETDRIGQFNYNRVNFAYAAHFNFTKINRLSLGVYGGLAQMGYDPTNATTADPDPVVLQQSNFLSPDASFGAWFNSENYYFGLIIKNMFRSQWEDIGNDSRHRFHVLLNGGYRLSINEDFSFLPQFNMRIPPRNSVSLDLNLYADYKNTFGFGIGFRNTDALIAILNIKFKEQFSIGYSFDYTLSQIQNGSSNTHEISLRFTTCKPDRQGTASCPLFE